MTKNRLLCLLAALLCCLFLADTALAAEKKDCHLGHTPVATPDKAPTCNRTGSVGGTHCKVCGITLTEGAIVPMLGHEWSQTRGYKAGFGYHKHHCKRCGAPWAIHCTLLADNHCVTCEYYMTTLLADTMTSKELKAAIAQGEPMIVITGKQPGMAVKCFYVNMYEAGEPINFTIEATISVPLSEDELARVTDDTMLQVTDDEGVLQRVEYTVEDGVLTFRTKLLKDFVLLNEGEAAPEEAPAAVEAEEAAEENVEQAAEADEFEPEQKEPHVLAHYVFKTSQE